MSGIFHSMKKAVVKGDARPDLEFQEAKARFDAYCATLLKLKGNLANYLTSATSLYVTSSQICQDFSVLLDDPTHPNDFTDHSNSMRIEHQTMSHEYVPKLQQSFSSTILSQIDEECVRNSEIQKRITRRQEVFGELGYYGSKMNELRDERGKQASKGKSESASDADKFSRNQKKFDEVQLTFTDINTRLMADLNQLWVSDRIARTGPLLQRFLAHEKKIAETYGAGLSRVQDKGVTQ